MTRDLSALREEYQRVGLDRGDLLGDPLAQFEAWFDAWLATEPVDANAMVLATADQRGRPSARYVLLKGIEQNDFIFFTNYESRKGRDLAANPFASLCFGWLSLARQVRVEGRVEILDAAASDQYFASRPRGSQLGAWASTQSEVVPDRNVLDQRLTQLDHAHQGHDIPRPECWGGYRLVPEAIEFWQGRTNRLHDRFRYRRAVGGGWLVERLSP